MLESEKRQLIGTVESASYGGNLCSVVSNLSYACPDSCDYIAEAETCFEMVSFAAEIWELPSRVNCVEGGTS